MAFDQSAFNERLLRALGADLRAEEVLERIVQTVTEYLDADAGFLYLKDRITGQLVLRSASVRGAHEHLRRHVGNLRLDVGQGLAGWALENHESGIIESNLRADERFHYMPSLREDAFNAALAVPIYLPDGRPIGVFSLYSVHAGFFRVEPIKAAEAVVRILARIVERAELAAEDRRKADVLTFLSNLARSLNQETSVHDVLGSVAIKTCSILNANCCMIVFIDEDSRIIFRADSDNSRDNDALLEGSLENDDITVRELRIGVDEENILNDILSGRANPKTTPFDEVVSGSLHAGLHRIGFIHCYRNYPFPREDQELLETISAQVALSLKSTQLMQSLKETSPIWRLFKLLENRNLVSEAASLSATLAIDLNKPHVVIFGRLVCGSEINSWEDSDVNAVLRKVENLIKAQWPGSQVYSDYGELMGIIRVRNDSGVSTVGKRLDEACKNVGMGKKILLSIGISTPASGVHQYADAFCEAREALKVGVANLGQGKSFTYEQIALYIYMHRIASDPRAKSDPLRYKFLRLTQYDKEHNTKLLNTIREYFVHHGNASMTCQSLRVHRNTLRQRLARIEELTGIDLRDKETWFAYQMGIQLAELLPEKPSDP